MKTDGSITVKENPDIDDSDNDDMEFEDAHDEEQKDRLMISMRKSTTRQSYLPFRGSVDQTMMRRFTTSNRDGDAEENNNNNLIESVISINHDEPYAQS